MNTFCRNSLRTHLFLPFCRLSVYSLLFRGLVFAPLNAAIQREDSSERDK